MKKELIVNTYSGTFSASGKWDFSGVVRGPMRSYPETLWLEGDNTGYADYCPEIMAVGKVRISAFIPGYINQDPEIKIEVHHSDKIDEVYVDGTNYPENGGDWLMLGTFEFAGKGDEFVRIARESGKGTTRISTVLFEILNSAGSIDVWQSVYVGPTRVSLAKKNLATFDAFCDLDDSKYKKEIEYLAYKGVIPKLDVKFKPEDAIAAKDFFEWLSKIVPNYVRPDVETINKNNVIKILYDTIGSSGLNTEHIGECTEKLEALQKLHIIYDDFAETNDMLTRAEAAYILKNLYYFMLGGVSADKWELTFYDDFEGDSINNQVWACENAASPHILSSRWRENVAVSDSKLKLVTKKEVRPECPQQNWTTGCVSVYRNVFSQMYGYWEASMKINKSPGINNAFWMVNKNFEIDIVEAHYINVVNSTYHHDGGAQGVRYRSEYDLSDDFHIYALQWNEKELIYYFDNKEIFRVENSNAHESVHPLFSSAVLNWAGAIDEDNADGCTMEVDWVRIYKEK